MKRQTLCDPSSVSSPDHGQAAWRALVRSNVLTLPTTSSVTSTALSTSRAKPPGIQLPTGIPKDDPVFPFFPSNDLDNFSGPPPASPIYPPRSAPSCFLPLRGGWDTQPSVPPNIKKTTLADVAGPPAPLHSRPSPPGLRPSERGPQASGRTWVPGEAQWWCLNSHSTAQPCPQTCPF